MSWTDKLAETRNQLQALNTTIPETNRAFGALCQTVKETGPLDFKTKEFIALGIAVAMRCDACIALHCEALVRVGATRAEVGDVLAMTIQMGGGPSKMYAAKALDCFAELSAG